MRARIDGAESVLLYNNSKHITILSALSAIYSCARFVGLRRIYWILLIIFSRFKQDYRFFLGKSQLENLCPDDIYQYTYGSNKNR